MMLAPDDKNSVLSEVSEQEHKAIAYSTYGYDEGGNSNLGYNGQLRDPSSGKYFLGDGYRMFSAQLMRFQAPDGALWSPFGKGGVNAYAYVQGNPIRWKDDTGHMVNPAKLKPVSWIKQAQLDAAAEIAGRSMHIKTTSAKVVATSVGDTSQITTHGVKQSKDLVAHTAPNTSKPKAPKRQPPTPEYAHSSSDPVQAWVEQIEIPNVYPEKGNSVRFQTPDSSSHSANMSAEADVIKLDSSKNRVKTSSGLQPDRRQTTRVQKTTAPRKTMEEIRADDKKTGNRYR